MKSSTNHFRNFIRASCPGIIQTISSLRQQLRCRRLFFKFQKEFRAEAYGSQPIVVLSGPLKGLAYYNKSVWGLITSKWIGSYEEELHSVLSKIIRNNYRRIIDVGAAEGYYAVGLAKMCPLSAVLAFDIDPVARLRMRQLRDLNSISNLKIGSYCTDKLLADSIVPQLSVLICDIEGYEYRLLDIEKVSKLASTDVLVEIHGFEELSSDCVKQTIKARFANTHRIQEFQVTDRDPRNYLKAISNLENIHLSDLAKAMEEHRFKSQEWLWMEARGGLASKESETS